MLKFVTIYPEYPISILQPDELAGYRKKILHARLDAPALIPILNGPSPLLRTVDGHHVNKAFIVAVRDYVDPQHRKSPLAEYERRSQIGVYVMLDMVTLEAILGVINIKRFCDDVEVCVERALIGTREYDFIGVLTDWKTTKKMDGLLDPSITTIFEQARLTQSYLAINKHYIKNYSLIRILVPGESTEAITAAPLFPEESSLS